MPYLISAMLVIVSIIHLMPLIGVLGNENLTTLYGLPFTDPNLSILMRHRAVLFGILGLFFLFAAFQPDYQTIAFIAAFLSIASFLWLAASVGGYNAQVARVFNVDIAALICTLVGGMAHFYLKSR